MRVRLAWSGEVQPNQWTKIAVEADETDLLRVLTTAGVTVGPDQLTTTQAFLLLDTEACRLLTAKLAAIGHTSPIEAAGTIAGYLSQQKTILDQLRGGPT